MARETGLEPATSGVTGRKNRTNVKAAPKIANQKIVSNFSWGTWRIWN